MPRRKLSPFWIAVIVWGVIALTIIIVPTGYVIYTCAARGACS